MSTSFAPTSPPKLLTYEAYMAEEVSNLRVDIVDGEKIFMTPTVEHQIILLNLAIIFRTYQKTTGKGIGLLAPCDVLISRTPLRTRQPDVFFISKERHALNPAQHEVGPLTAAPELVVEIISGSETARRFNGKINDYCKVEVLECWKVMPETQTVEVLRLSRNGAEPIQTYSMGETVQSLAFPDLTAAVEAIFAA